MNFVMRGDFVLRSGKKSSYKIECDALTKDDWDGIAAGIMEELDLPPFRHAVGVPRGGIPLANALNAYAQEVLTGSPVLICEDVVTTGGSLEKFRRENYGGEHVIGVAFVCRGSCPEWVRPLFVVGGKT